MDAWAEGLGQRSLVLQPEDTLQLGKSKAGWAWHRATAAVHRVRAVTAPSLSYKPR